MPGLLNILAALGGVLSVVYASNDAFSLGHFENLNVVQNIDLTHPYVKQTVDLRVVNVGSESEGTYVVPIPDKWAASLAGIEARDSESNYLPVSLLDPYSVSGYSLYQIGLGKPLEPKEKREFSYVLAFVDGVTPLPAAAKQSDSQWLLYNATRNVVSVYRTRTQKTRVNILLDSREDLDVYRGADKPEFNAEDNTLTYGPYERVKALETLPLTLRFENPMALLRIEKLERKVWVSHWGGSVSFDETYDLHNVGTRIDKFSRADFGKMHATFNLNSAAVRHLALKLPVGHREEYYVDQIGNVSTSRVQPGTLEILPRYPLMGGWFYNFTVGWASDLSNFVRSPAPNSFILAVPLLGGPEATSYKKLSTSIVLPEGAESVEVFSDVPYKSLKHSVTYSYLDIYGRPTVNLEFENLVSDYANANLLVTYQYSTAAAFKKPLSYTAIAFATFASIHFLSKLFFS